MGTVENGPKVVGVGVRDIGVRVNGGTRRESSRVILGTFTGVYCE